MHGFREEKASDSLKKSLISPWLLITTRHIVMAPQILLADALEASI